MASPLGIAMLACMGEAAGELALGRAASLASVMKGLVCAGLHSLLLHLKIERVPLPSPTGIQPLRYIPYIID